MVEQETPDPLTKALKAAGDPTRRAILTLLAQNGPTRVTEISGRFSQSLNAISRHIMVLEDAGLVRRRTVWRAHYIEIDLSPLAAVEKWFGSLRSIWALRLEALDTAFKQETQDEPDGNRRAYDDSDAGDPRPARPRL